MSAVAAKDLTIGVCHPAYRIFPVLSAQLPEATVFQEHSADAIKSHMPQLDVLVISGAWRDDLLDGTEKLRWIQPSASVTTSFRSPNCSAAASA